MKARLKSKQIVSVEVLAEKEGWFGKKYLVKFKADNYRNGQFTYESSESEWVKEENLFRTPHTEEKEQTYDSDIK